MTTCICGAATEGKWADRHTVGCPALDDDGGRLVNIIGELYAAIVQSVPSDDQIIMEHVRNAHSLACEMHAAMREREKRRLAAIFTGDRHVD